MSDWARPEPKVEKGEPILAFNRGEVDIDFRVIASVVTEALVRAGVIWGGVATDDIVAD